MKIKKIIAAVTALVLVGGAYNATAAKNVISSVFAADTEASAEVVKDGIKYTISNGEATVKGLVDRTIIDLVIPDEVDGCPVTEIGSYSINPEYDEVSHIRSLVLGKNVKKIGWDAFSDCYELETVTLNDALEEIDNYAFSSCYNLKEVKTGSKLKYIGIDAFRMCLSLESFEIGENVNEIGQGAFNRSGIEVFEVPERFTEIENVFYNYYPLHKYGGIIKIKNPECKIYGSGSDWENVLIVCDENSYARRQANLYEIKCCTFEQYEKGEYEKTELSPFDSQITIRDYGMIFEETEGGLKVDGIAYAKDNTLVVPDEVAGIPVVEFPSLHAEEGVHKINDGVANDIKKIVLGKNVKRLGDYAFDEFTNLEYIEGGESVEKIGENAFNGLFHLKSISFKDNWRNIDFPFSDKGMCSLLIGMVIDEVEGGLRVRCIGGENIKDSTLVIPDEIKGIPVVELGWVKDSYCDYSIIEDSEVEKIKKVVIGKNVKLIDKYAFKECENIETIEGGQSLEVIGEEAFKECIGLTSLKLPENVRQINEYAFANCSALKKVEFNDKLEDIGENAFAYCTALEEVNLPNSLSSIKPHTFEDTNIKSIVIPEGVKEIGSTAFSWSGSASETVVKIYDPDCEIGTYSFVYIKDVAKLYGYAGSTAAKLADLWRMDNFYAFGDANCDSGVDMGDVVLVMQSLANPNKYGLNGTDEHHMTEKGTDCADVEENGNGITAGDALKIQKYLLGQEKFS